jgi:hypothetical protein
MPVLPFIAATGICSFDTRSQTQLLQELLQISGSPLAPSQENRASDMCRLVVCISRLANQEPKANSLANEIEARDSINVFIDERRESSLIINT